MLNKENSRLVKYTIIIYILLTALTAITYWQVNQFNFIDLDDFVYVTENLNIKSGISAASLRWAFSTTYAEFWHPLTWLSLMVDYQLYGLNAGGYHVTNLILHILSTILLFWLFSRMTRQIWPSAFVAAFFALHPLHVESVAWVSERKDVLSAFFWMLTLCLYVYYTEKPAVKRYLLVLFSFVLALMSKPMVVTLPLIMILLDYWPLKRFELNKNKMFLWQLKEKLPLFVLSGIFSIITIYAQHDSIGSYFPFLSRLANAPVAFVSYIGKAFSPHDLAVFYPFPSHIPIWQVAGASLFILIVTCIVIVMMRRLPQLFVGWFWYMIIMLPVIGIVQVGNHAMADRYTYLSLIGIGVMITWGVPLLIPRQDIRKKVLFPLAILFIIFLTFFTWRQCDYWRNSITIFNHALKLTKDNYIAHDSLGAALFKKQIFNEAMDHFNQAIRIRPEYYKPYDSRGVVYDTLGNYEQAISDFDQAIRLNPENAPSYNNRGAVYDKSGRYEKAIHDYNTAIRLQPGYAVAYNNRGIVFAKLGQTQQALEDFSKAIQLNPAFVDAYNNRAAMYDQLGQYDFAINDLGKAIAANPDDLKSYINIITLYGRLNQYEDVVKYLTEAIRLQPDNALFYYNRGFAYANIGQLNLAINDLDEAIKRKEDYADAYNTRASIYLNQRNMVSGCLDARRACELGKCSTLQLDANKGLCR